jgi:hypothetical protein
MLYLPNVTLLGLNQSYRFLGAGFNYSNSKTLSIEGTLNDLINSSGISGTWENVYRVKTNPNFEGAIINGYNFGSGRVLSYSFPQGDDVRLKGYSLELEVFETGDLYNLTGIYYSGINFSESSYLQNFSESYSFNKKVNGGYSYNRNASIQFNSGLGQLNAIQAAKNFAKSLFTGASLGFAFYSGFTNKQGKRFYTESYNLIDNSCQFGETFDFDSNQGSYSLTQTNNFSLDEAGIITVLENGTIKGIERPTYEKAIAAIDSVISQSYNRATGVFGFYAPIDSYPLINTPISQSRALNIFDNTFNYNIVYSNNRANSGNYFWNYSQNLSKIDGISILTENGNVIGRGGDKTISYLNAKNGFTAIRNGAYLRGLSFYQENSLSAPIYIESQTRSDSPLRGSIDYGFTFSNESVETGFGGIKYMKIKESNTNPIYSYTQFGIFNEKTIIQDESNGTPGVKSYSLEIKGEKGVSLSTYLENGKIYLNSNIPGGQNVRINQAEYSYSPNNNMVALNVGWEYNQSAIKTVKI